MDRRAEAQAEAEATAEALAEAVDGDLRAVATARLLEAVTALLHRRRRRRAVVMELLPEAAVMEVLLPGASVEARSARVARAASSRLGDR